MSKAGTGYDSFLPSGWFEDDKMRVLMSAFQSRELNPHGYDYKMRFWKDAILKMSHGLKDPLVTYPDLEQRFRRRGSRSLALPTVFKTMIEEGKLVELSRFKSGQSGWVSRAVETGSSLLKSAAGWIWSTAASAASTSNDEWYAFRDIIGAADELGNAEYVVINVVEALACDVERIYRDYESGELAAYGPPRAMPVRRLYQMCQEAGAGIPRRAFELVLTQLEREGIATVVRDGYDEELVKFGDRGGRSASTLPAVSDVDKALIRLEKTARKLERDTDALQDQLRRKEQAVRQLLRMGQKPRALAALREKKLLEKQLSEKDGSLQKITSLRFQLENAHSNNEVLAAFQNASSALKVTNPTLTELDDTMDALHDTMADQDEIASALSTPLSPNQFDQDELDAELNALLGEAGPSTPGSSPGRKRNALDTVEIQFPSVPTEDEEPSRAKHLRLGGDAARHRPPPMEEGDDRLSRLRRQLAEA